MSACNAGDLGLIPGSGRSPVSRKWQPTSLLLPGKFQGCLVGYSPWGRKESDTTEQLHLFTGECSFPDAQQGTSYWLINVWTSDMWTEHIEIMEWPYLSSLYCSKSKRRKDLFSRMFLLFLTFLLLLRPVRRGLSFLKFRELDLRLSHFFIYKETSSGLKTS